MSRAARRGAAGLALALALPALAYVLPVPGILRRLGERRAALSLDSLEVSGTLTAEGDAGARLAAATGLPAAGGQVSAPARLRVKIPGRCRLDLAVPDAPEAARPFVAVRDGKLSGGGGLDQLPAAVALVRGICALLATPVAGDASAAYAAALGRRGVSLADASLARFDGRLAYVIGGRAKDPKPLAFVEKDGFQPLRLVAAEGGALADVRLLGWGSPMGGDWFPGAVEVWRGEAAALRLATEKTVANPKLDF
ncbi:MAG TPA: hypothetical protein VIW03_08405 [Anaeromyxobacter sp.]